MHARTFILALCSAGALLALALAACPATADIAAGAARVDITPSLTEFPTISLAGFGEREGKPAQSVRDHIFSRALVLSDGHTRVALVSTDLIGISPGMKEAVVEKVADLGFTANNLLLAATHNHSAPECLHPQGDVWPLAFGRFLPAYFEFTNTRIAESIRAATARMQPAQVGFAAAPLKGFNRNRREAGEGVVDPTMTVMKVTTAGAGPAETLALVVDFTAHPTIMGPKSFAISGEFPGAMSRALESRMSAGSAALFFNGAQGDQTHAGDFGSGWDRVDAYGKALAEKAWELSETAQVSDDAAITLGNVMWGLPQYRMSPAFIESTGQEYKLTPEMGIAIASKLFPRAVQLQAVRIGDAVLMAVPGEATAELGLAMKRNAVSFGARYPVIVGLANNAIGYILSPEQYRLGEYESGTSFYGPQLGAILVSQMKETVRPLFRRH
jgi:neutral ceramidase